LSFDAFMVGGAAVPDASVASAETCWEGELVEAGCGVKGDGGRVGPGALLVMLNAAAS
jgi:hypothetical protein